MQQDYSVDYSKVFAHRYREKGLFKRITYFKQNIEKFLNEKQLNDVGHAITYKDFIADFESNNGMLLDEYEDLVIEFEGKKDEFYIMIEGANLSSNKKSKQKENINVFYNTIKNEFDSFKSKCQFFKFNLILLRNSQHLDKVKNDFVTAKKELDTEEHRILTHVLTLLGVFTAIITIILTAVSASTSWLNKSDSADFVLAVLVPAIIVIITMVVMFCLLYLMIFKKYNKPIFKEELEGKKCKSKDIKGIWSVILLVLISIALLSIMTGYIFFKK